MTDRDPGSTPPQWGTAPSPDDAGGEPADGAPATAASGTAASGTDESAGTEATGPEVPPKAAEPSEGSGFGRDYVHAVLSSSWLLTLAAILLALVIGAVLIVAADPASQAAAVYLFARPGDFFSAAATAVGQAYLALFQGAVYDSNAPSAARAIRPITETLTIATPLILAGLGVGLAFRAGLFNIGGQSQITLGAVAGAFLGFSISLPPIVHTAVVLLGALLGGALAGFIPGFLKARFGAHEVIVTIMLNNISRFFGLWVVATAVFASATPQVSRRLAESAMLPNLFGPPFRLHAGFLLALVAAFAVWWLMERSVLGFRLRAVGSNAEAARTAGMNARTTTVLAMVIAGSLCGLAGGILTAGTEGTFTAAIAGTIGFDAITVALLGRSKPLGTVLAGILFGAFAAGGRLMVSRTGTPIDLVLVLQSLIVLFIAAPPLVRMLVRLPAPGQRRKKRTPATKEAASA